MPSFHGYFLLPVTCLLLVCGSASSAGVIFQARGSADSVKTLDLYGFVGDGVITEADFLAGTLIGSVDLTPTGGDNVDIRFDASDFFDSLPNNTQHVGFRLQESESAGSVVATEYLLLGTIVALASIVGLALVQSGTPGTPDAVVGDIDFDGLPHFVSNPVGLLETRSVVEFQLQVVPEPSMATLTLLAGGILLATMLAKRARNRPHIDRYLPAP